MSPSPRRVDKLPLTGPRESAGRVPARQGAV